ncbi:MULTISPECIES: hypothetical protein [Gordonia]|nr:MULTISPECIES: hypothetical protein [Gordonia]
MTFKPSRPLTLRITTRGVQGAGALVQVDADADQFTHRAAQFEDLD